MKDEVEKYFAGPTIEVEFGGQSVTTTICEHNQPAIECQECDILGAGYKVFDRSRWRSRLADPIGWLRIRWWIIKQNWRNS